LVRTGLVDELNQLAELLESWFERDGTLTEQAAGDAVVNCFAFLDGPLAVDRFCRRYVDPRLDELIRDHGDEANWPAICFTQMAELLLAAVLEVSDTSPELGAIVTKVARRRVAEWCDLWGYASARFEAPAGDDSRTGVLLREVLRQHAREMLYQLARETETDADAMPIQDEADKRNIVELMTQLERARELAGSLGRQYGVPL
jgi:hypothetical protein